MLPGGAEDETISDVVDKIVTIRTEHETANRRFFEVVLEGVWPEAGLTDPCIVEEYLIQHGHFIFEASKCALAADLPDRKGQLRDAHWCQ